MRAISLTLSLSHAHDVYAQRSRGSVNGQAGPYAVFFCSGNLYVCACVARKIKTKKKKPNKTKPKTLYSILYTNVCICLCVLCVRRTHICPHIDDYFV